MKTRNIGIVKLDMDLVKRWLQLPNAEILAVSIDSVWEAVDITMEDAEMPEIEAGCVIPYVDLVFTRYEDMEGHTVEIREKVSV